MYNKTRKISFRVTEEEFKQLQINVAKNKQTVTGYIRQTALCNNINHEIVIRSKNTHVAILSLYQMVEKMESNSNKEKQNYREIKNRLGEIAYDVLQNS